jgi:hypothetical protein
MKTVQLSTRVTDSDSAFLASLEIDGAQTPSDKLRALIEDARKRREGTRDYKAGLRLVEDMLAPALERIRGAENRTEQHSELVNNVITWITETLAFVMSRSPDQHLPPEEGDELSSLERGLADRAFLLIESVLRLGVTGEAPCYDRKAIAKRMPQVVELVQLIASRPTHDGA